MTSAIPGVALTNIIEHVYTPLVDAERQFRLLRLAPDRGDELSFTLETFDRDTAPEYKAISYTWGIVGEPQTLYFDDDISEPQPIYIDGKRFRTLDNCSYVLLQAQPQYSDGYLWIDQICINQQSNSEKSAQVRVMDRIFARAVVVLVCLGPHRRASRLVVGATRDIQSWRWPGDHVLLDNYNDDEREKWNVFERQKERWILQRGLRFFERLFHALKEFGNRRYWSRLWIVQEIACAASVLILCGHHVVPWKALQILDNICGTITGNRKISSAFGSPPIYYHNFFSTVAATGSFIPGWHLNPVEHPIPSLADVFNQFNMFECRDARDRIYGMLPLCREFHFGTLRSKIDYNVSKFDLAVQVIDYISLFTVPRLLASLKIDSTDNIMDMKVRRMRHETPSATLANHAPGVTAPYRRLSPDPRIATIKRDIEGRLTTTFVKSLQAVGGRMPQFFHYQHFEPNHNHEEVVLKTLATPKVDYQEIYVGSEVAALTNRDARVDDLLLPFGTTHTLARPDLFLLLRSRAAQTYDIIGQAISINGYTMCGVAADGWDFDDICICKEPTDLQHVGDRVAATIDITSEEVVVLLGQDILNPVSDERILDPRKRILRPLTRVTDYGSVELKDLKDTSDSTM